MDSLKACVNPTDNCGFLTAGEERTLELTIEKTGVAVEITGATFETRIPANHGGTLVLPDASHTIVEDGVDDDLNGRVDLELTAAESATVKRGRKIPFMTRVTLGGLTTDHWGELDEVREPIK